MVRRAVGLLVAGAAIGVGADRLAAELVERRLVASGAVVVFINVSRSQDRSDANFLHVRQLSAPGAP